MAELDSKSDAFKAANKAAADARKERDYYKGLSGMYQLTYDEDTNIHTSIMVLQGIYVEFMSDLLKFKQKNGNTEQAKASKKRLDAYLNEVNCISKIQTSNIALKSHLKKLETRNHLLFCEIQDLKNQLILHTENL